MRDRPAILYLTHRVPFPLDKGDRIRNFQILRHLCKQADVHLACLADEPVAARDLEVLQSLCRRVAVVPLGRLRWARALWSLVRGGTASEGAFASARLRETVRSWARETPFRGALASASSVARYLQVPELASAAKVIDVVDVDSQKWFDFAASSRGPKAWLYRTEGRRLRRLEQLLTRSTQAITLVSNAEVEIFQSFAGDDNARAVPNGVDLDFFKPGQSEGDGSESGPLDRPQCVFVGALDYWPNVEGISWFCRTVWPLVRQRFPQSAIALVGRRPVAAVQRLANLPGVQVVGQVPDVRPFLAAAHVSVVPLRLARGIQNKVLESLAMAKATVVSPQALEGIEAQPGLHLLQATTSEDWVEMLHTLFTNRHLRLRLAQSGRAFTEQFHRWEICLQPLLGLLGLPRLDPEAIIDEKRDSTSSSCNGNTSAAHDRTKAHATMA